MSKLIERDGKYLIEVGPNDSFGSIAYEHTGQSSRWLDLLKCNDVDATRPIVSGILLKMPDTWAEERADGKWGGAPELTKADPTANTDAPPAQSGSAGMSREELESLFQGVLGPWAENADRVILELKEKVQLLEMKRDQDEKRLAEQGAKILTLETRVLGAVAPALPVAPPVEDPNRTGGSGGTG